MTTDPSSAVSSSSTKSNNANMAHKVIPIHILICSSGSIATLKIPELINQIKEKISVYDNNNHNIDTINDKNQSSSSVIKFQLHIKLLFSSPNAIYFFDKAKEYDTAAWSHFLDLHDIDLLDSMIIQEEDEWNLWQHMGDPVLHIELRKWSDIIVLAPVSANILAKISHGMADSLLLTMLRAIEIGNPRQQILVCPAMNTAMWNHPCTLDHVNQLIQWNYKIVMPMKKVLACGEEGIGALASIDTIVHEIKEACYSCVNNRMSTEEVEGRRNQEGSEEYLDILLQRAVSLRKKNQQQQQQQQQCHPQKMNVYSSFSIDSPSFLTGIAIGAITALSLLYVIRKQ